MKKISLLLVSIALFGFIALNTSCKSKTAQPAETEEVMEEAPAEEAPVADTAAAMEAPAEEAPAVE